MKPLDSDPCVYIAKRGNDTLLLAVYVDDMLVISQNLLWISELKEKLKIPFELKDLGEVRQCLGMEFTMKEGKIRIAQKQYTEEVLSRFGMENSKPVSTPLDPGTKLVKPDSCLREELEEYPFRELIGSLMYLAVGTRPDIAFAVNSLSQYNTCYNKEHWVAAKRVLRYLKGTTNHGITFKKTGIVLEGYTNADWASCTNDRRSYTGFVFILGGTAITWEAKKQRTVALSSTEAEYMALSEAAKEAMYLRRFLEKVGVKLKQPTVVWNDNQGAQKLARNNVFRSRTKHIDIRHHFIREVLQDAYIRIDYMTSNEMMADVLTKGLAGPKHLENSGKMGVGPYHGQIVGMLRTHV